MPPRGSEGLDFTPILTHYLFLFTSILAIVGWFVAFIAQAVVTSKFGHDDVGVLWFSIFLQLFLILGVFYTLASDSIAMHRLQISVFGAIAVVFAVEGVDKGIFTGDASRGAMAAGWLILAVVDILWVLYFTSEEDSLALHVFNSLGTGGLTPPSRRRRGTRTASVHNMGVGNGYGGAYSSAAGIGPASYDAKLPNSFSPATALRSQNSLHGGSADGGAPRGMGPPGSGPNSPAATASVAALPSSNPNPGVSSPLMSPGNAGVGAGGGPALPADTSGDAEQPLKYPYRAKASFAYTANTEDPNEISFQKGEIMDIMDKNGKWWQARKEDGTIGIVPSNYLQII